MIRKMDTFKELCFVNASDRNLPHCQRHDTACPIQVLREHRETLVSVMETFVHDPLCEWTKRNRSSEETGNPQAKDALRTLEGGRSTLPFPVCFSHARWQLREQGAESAGLTSVHGLLSR